MADTGSRCFDDETKFVDEIFQDRIYARTSRY